MSFFIRNSRGRGATKRKFTGPRKNTNEDFKGNNSKQKKFNHRDDESIASSDEELAEERQKKINDYPTESEDEEETAKEKRVRLAKKILAEVEEKERDRADFDEGAVSQRLRDDYLEQKGRLRKTLADKYCGHDDLIYLKCKDHKGSITSICLSANGKFLYSGSKDGGIVKWSLATKLREHVLPGKRKKSSEGIKSVTCMALSTDGKFLAAGDGGCKEIKVFNAEDLKFIKNLQGHRGTVTGLAFRKDTHTLYSASEDRSVKIWNLDEMAYVESLFGHQSPITAIDALSRERAITSGGFDKSVRIWKIAEESQLIFNGHENSIDAVKLLNDENFLTCGDDGQLCLWSMQKKKPLCSVSRAHGVEAETGQPTWISSIAVLLNTDLVASGSKDGAVRLWQCGEGFKSLQQLFEIKIVGFINSMVFTPDGENLIVGVGQEHKLGRWWRIPQAKNQIVIVPLKQNKSTK